MWHSIGLWMHGFLAGALSATVVYIAGAGIIWWKFHLPLKQKYEQLKDIANKV